jgi:hypothetical protein
MESTMHANSRLMNEINRENKVIIDARNRQTTLRHYWPEIVSEKRVTMDPEIATVIWVPADVWSREPQRIHDRSVKLITKIDSCLTHGIIKYIMLGWSRNRQRKLSHCRTRNHLWNWVTADGWNRQRILIHGWRTKSIEKTYSSLTHGIVWEKCVTTD